MGKAGLRWRLSASFALLLGGFFLSNFSSWVGTFGRRALRLPSWSTWAFVEVFVLPPVQARQ